MQEVIKKVDAKVKELLSGEATGHDWYHIDQVRKMALRIAEVEGGDRELIELAALAHDIGDHKFHSSVEAGEAVTRAVLAECGLSAPMLEQVMDIVSRVSYKGPASKDEMSNLEGKIVQDADRLYALGAIGIARAFAYGGSKHRPLYIPEHKVDMSLAGDEYLARPDGTTIGHFYEKILLIKDRLHTNTARQIGDRRHRYIEDFLKQFYAEWEVRD